MFPFTWHMMSCVGCSAVFVLCWTTPYRTFYIHPEKAHTHSINTFHVNSPPCWDNITEHETQCAWHNDTWLAGALSLYVSSALSATQCSDVLLTDTGASCSYSQVRLPHGMEGPLHDWVWFTIYVKPSTKVYVHLLCSVWFSNAVATPCSGGACLCREHQHILHSFLCIA